MCYDFSMNKIDFKRALFLIIPLLLPSIALATVGVGVGSGKINVTQKLFPGGVYELPPITVLNTGDEPSQYGMSIEYQEAQNQIKPTAEWFTFTPSSFRLEPKQAQVVKITLTLPVKAHPGDYFSYIEAHPVIADVVGHSRVNIAAASKLYFTVDPANLLQAALYRAMSFLNDYKPWSYITSGIMAFILLIFIIRRFFSFNIGVSLKK